MLSLDVREKTLHVIALLERGPVGGGRLLTLTQACQEVGMSYAQMRHAVKSDPDLRRSFDAALAMSEDIMADMLVNIDLVESDPKMAAVLSKNIQWLLARRRRADYGDHVTVEHTTTRDQELLKRMAAARERALENNQGPLMIDGEFSEGGGASPDERYALQDPQEPPPLPFPAPSPAQAPTAAPQPTPPPAPDQETALRALGLLP